jgi:hypothetical protein
VYQNWTERYTASALPSWAVRDEAHDCLIRLVPKIIFGSTNSKHSLCSIIRQQRSKRQELSQGGHFMTLTMLLALYDKVPLPIEV